MLRGEVKYVVMKLLASATCVKVTHKLIGEATRGWTHRLHDAANLAWSYALNKRVIVMNRLSLANRGFIK